jgi:hypothetical protein
VHRLYRWLAAEGVRVFWKRLERNGETNAEAQQASDQAREEAQRRLGRIVERRREEAVVEAPGEESKYRDLGTQFAECAFVVLGVPMDADRAAIAQAVDELAFAEDIDPAAIETARAELMAPRERIRHELAWLPGTDASIQAEVRDALRRQDGGQILASRLASQGLARVNLGLSLLPAHSKDEKFIRALMADLLGWDPQESRDRIDEARLRAGTGATKDDHFGEALGNYRRTVGRAFAERLSETREGRALLAEKIAGNSAEVRACSAPMLEAIAHEFGALADPKLQGLRGKIEDACAALTANPRDPAKVTLIITTLDLWSQWRLPLQKLEEARGLDDPQSSEIFEKLRQLAIKMSNEHQMFDESLRLARALKHCFAAVPGLQQAIGRDLPALMGNVLFKRYDHLAHKVIADLSGFVRDVARAGMGDVGGTVGQFCQVFDELLEINPHEEALWTIFRAIAVAIANKKRRPDISLVIIEWLLERNSPEKVRNQLVEDFCKLQPRRD